ncbi:MAG: HesB/IscA family protein [Dehalococcoidia bacterium]
MSEGTDTGQLQTIEPHRLVTLTDEAAGKIKPALERFSASALRITAEQDEAGTVNYSFDLEQERRPDDLVLKENGVTVFVGQASVPYLQDREIHFIETERGPGFAVVDPSASCGCGDGSCGCSR